jgi:hypothetical protein
MLNGMSLIEESEAILINYLVKKIVLINHANFPEGDFNSEVVLFFH